MKNKIFLLLALLCTLLLSVGSVCAADADISVENLSCSGEFSVVSDDLDSNDISSVGDDSNSTNGSVGSFSDIQKLIDETENNTIYLNNTTYYGNGFQIIVNKSITINGAGATLDAKKLSRIFYIVADNVTLLNLNLTNGNGLVDYDIEPFPHTPSTYDIGGAVYWKGNNGKLVNSSMNNNSAQYASAIYWTGINGSVVNSYFKRNIQTFSDINLIYTVHDQELSSCFISGVINGFYDGNLINDTYLKEASVNSNFDLEYNNYSIYNGYLIIKLIDDNGLPYFKDTVICNISSSNSNYLLEFVINENGFAKVKLPTNLTVGNYNITFYLKKIHSIKKIYNSSIFSDIYNYKHYLINSSSLSVVKSNATLKNADFSICYGCGKFYGVKLADNNGVGVSGVKVKFRVYSNSKLLKTIYVTTNSNGVATLKHNFKPGKYVVKIESTNQNYNVKSVKSTLKVSKAPVTIKAPKVTKKYHKKAYFKINIMNKATKKVIKGLKIRIKVYTGKKYKTYSVKTNSKGVASLSTKSFEKGKHKVIITSDNNCYSISKKGNLIVIK